VSSGVPMRPRPGEMLALQDEPQVRLRCVCHGLRPCALVGDSGPVRFVRRLTSGRFEPATGLVDGRPQPNRMRMR